MTLKLVKYLVAAVLIEEDEEGLIVGEHQLDTATCYGRAQLEQHLGNIDRLIQEGPQAPPPPAA